MNLILKKRMNERIVKKANEINNCAEGAECFGDGKEKRMIDNNDNNNIIW